MSDPGKAVFLSYASQDAAAAKRICDALRTGGVEVWFDADGGLEHGDEWDQKIRRQIKECVLFIPVISANTQAREEGYFRLEWDLAAERARTIASGVPFILPVVIDDTREPDALVPDRFRLVQWTKLRGGEVPPEVQQRLLKLWSHRTGVLKNQSAEGGPATPAALSGPEARVTPAEGRRFPVAAWGVAAMAVALAVGGYFWLQRSPGSAPTAAKTAGAATRPPATESLTPLAAVPVAAPLSDARKLAVRAKALVEALEGTREDYQLAEELITQAKAKDATDAEVCAVEAHIHESFIQRGWDTSDARREAARVAVQRAMRLDPTSFEARYAQARLLGLIGREGAERERQLRELRRERPTDQRILRALATVIDRLGRIDESAVIARESAALPGGDPLALYSLSQAYWFGGRANEAEAAIEASLAQKPFTGALLMNVWYKTTLRGDLERARKIIEQIDPAQRTEDRAAYFAYCTELFARNANQAIAWLKAVPRDWLNDSWYRGPKGMLMGDAHRLAGRTEAAAIEWRAALKLVEQRLVERPKDLFLLHHRTRVLAKLGQRPEAERQFAVLLEVAGFDLGTAEFVAPAVTESCIALGRKAEAIRQIASFIKRSPNWAALYPAAVLRLDPTYDPLRTEPEFAAVIAEVEAKEKLTAGKAASAATTPAVTDGQPAPVEKSVAVLAFANLSDDKANEYFSDGISEELRNLLSEIPGLKVMARASAFSFKGRNVPIPEIARQLGVAYVVDGSVRRSGNQVRITVQLLKAADGFQVWSDTFRRELQDIFAVQDEIARLVAGALQVRLGADAAHALTRGSTQNPAAYEAFLKGRQAYNASSADQRTAVGHLQTAVQLDPKFALAHGALAEAYVAQANVGAEPPGKMFPLARAAAEQALALDPRIVQAYTALAECAFHFDWDYEKSDEFLRQALAVDPNYAGAHGRMAGHNNARGRFEEGLAGQRRVKELDPFDQAANEAWTFASMQRYPDAIAAAREHLARFPEATFTRATLGFALYEDGKPADAMRVFEELAAKLPDDPLALSALAWGLGRGGQTARALSLLERMAVLGASRHISPLFPAYAASGMGDRDLAFAHLERAFEVRDPHLPDIGVGPLFAPIRSDPRFRAMLQRLKLDRYFPEGPKK